MNKYAQSAGADSKAARQRRLRKLIRTGRAATQGSLVRELKRAGFACTQACVSRDIAELGLIKQAGRYAEGPDAPEQEATAVLVHSVHHLVRSVEAVGPYMVVVKTLPGMAPSVGEFLDHARWEGLAGTVAGDNTIFVAAHGARSARLIAEKLRRITGAAG